MRMKPTDDVPAHAERDLIISPIRSVGLSTPTAAGALMARSWYSGSAWAKYVKIAT